MIEVICECGGYIDNKSYICVRCKRQYTQVEFHTEWLKQFGENHTLPDK